MSDEKHTTSIPPGIASTAAYLIPFIGGLVMLAIEKEDRLVRFHAAQSIVYWFCVLILGILNFIPLIRYLYAIAFIASWIFLMYQAWMGREFEIPYLGAIARKQVFNGDEPAPEEPPVSEERTEE